MATYIIGYDLNKSGKDYAGLIEAIKSLGGGWWHHLDSTWIITHPGPAATIRDRLMPFLDANDELLVLKSGGEGAWTGFNDAGSKWLTSHL